MPDNSGSWWTAALAAIPGVGAAGWAFVKFFSERSDKAETERDKIWERLNAAQAAWFLQQERTISGQQKRIEELEADRDRGWDLGRYWNSEAHRMRHLAANARMVAEQLASRQHFDMPAWEPHDLTLLAMEEPVIGAPATKPQP